jgi:hypothetical protein
LYTLGMFVLFMACVVYVQTIYNGLSYQYRW